MFAFATDISVFVEARNKTGTLQRKKNCMDLVFSRSAEGMVPFVSCHSVFDSIITNVISPNFI